MTTALRGHKVLLGVSGGIASYKSAVLARRLIDAGAEVRVVMTRGAQAFVAPLTFQALTGEPVHTDLLDPAAEAAMGHIELARWADSVLIAPASANTIARLAGGFADDLLGTLCLATDAPLHLAPAMNRLMWSHAATRENVARLLARGVVLFGPDDGVQACGEVGSGRMSEPEALRDALAERVAARSAAGEHGNALGMPPNGALDGATDRPPTDGPPTGKAIDGPAGGSAGVSSDVSTDREDARAALAGVLIVITAGPTREAIDPVRYVSNHSSGRMGYALAAVAAARGAQVTLVSGPVSLATPDGVERVDVTSAREMREAVLAHLGEGAATDVFISVAAVADYRVADVAGQKIKKRAEGMTLELVRNPDILAEVAALPEPLRPFCVGFAAETENVETYARGKLERKRLDMIAANEVGRPGREVFGTDTNALDVYWPPDGHARIDTATKRAVAGSLLALVAERFRAVEPASTSAPQAARRLT